MSNQAARFVGSIPENYDKGLGPIIFAGFATDIARRVTALQPTSVLELAAGTGIVTRQLRDELPSACDLIATDLNQPMLEVAKSKFRSDEMVRFEQADAMDLRYEHESFDLVLCQFGVMFFPDKERSHAQVLRVLKPGGNYLFTLWDSWDANTFVPIIHDTIAQFFPDDPPGFYKVPYGYHDDVEIRGAALRAGFGNVTIERLERLSKIESADSFARGLVFGNPLVEEIITRGGDPSAVCEALERAIQREMGDELLLKIILACATKDRI